MALLSTYLGHVDPGQTYWYLSAAPELLQLASARLERHLGGRWKRRITPLTSTMVAVLRVWLAERGCRPIDPLFASKTGPPTIVLA